MITCLFNIISPPAILYQNCIDTDKIKLDEKTEFYKNKIERVNTKGAG